MFYDSNILLENQYRDAKSKLYFKVWSNDDGGVPHVHISTDAIPSKTSKFNCCVCLTNNISFPHKIFTDEITQNRCDEINEYLNSDASENIKSKIKNVYGIECSTMYDVFRVLWNKTGSRTQYISYTLDCPTYDHNIRPYQDCGKSFHLNTINKSELNNELKNKEK